MINYLQQKSIISYKKHGFLYLDLLVMLASVSFCMILLAQQASAIIIIHKKTIQYLQALDLAATRLDEVIVSKQLPSALIEAIPNYTITWTIVSSEISISDTSVPLYICEITVSWIQADGASRKLSLRDGFVVSRSEE